MFAALGDPWLVNFYVRLLEGRPEVLKLIKKNPFADKPPKYIRATLYTYRFPTPAQRRSTGAWWQREYRGEYCPRISLQRHAEP